MMRKEIIVKEFYEFIVFIYREYPEILIEYNKKLGRPIKVPMLEYYKDNPEMMYIITGKKKKLNQRRKHNEKRRQRRNEKDCK